MLCNLQTTGSRRPSLVDLPRKHHQSCEVAKFENQKLPSMFRLLSLFLLVALLSLIGVAKAEQERHDAHVLVLDTSNFTEVVGEHPFIVVEFYAPWCGHCKRLAPEYEKAAAALKTHEPPIVLAKVDANDGKNKALAGQYNVRGFPTLKIIEKMGTVVRDFKGPRDADGIVSYLRKESGPPSQEIISAEQGQKLVEENEILIVGIFSSYDSEEFTNFTSVASELRSDYSFCHALDASLLPAKPVAFVSPSIRLFKKFDEGFNDLKEFSIDVMKKFMDMVSVPLVVTFSKDASQRAHLNAIFSNPSNSKIFLFINFTADNIEEYKTIYTKLAGDHRPKGLRFLIADSKEGKNAMEYFGVNEDIIPAIVAQGSDQKKYMLKEVQATKIESWLKDYIDGKLLEYLKSEPVPEKNDDPVKVVVGSSFKDMLLKSGKNVLLEIYAPWCGHCKKLAPILEEVAISLQSYPDVMVAKLDGTANDINDEDFEVKGFPTLLLRSVTGKVIPYVGDRSKEDIISFVTRNKDSWNSHVNVETSADDSGVLKDEL